MDKGQTATVTVRIVGAHRVYPALDTGEVLRFVQEALNNHGHKNQMIQFGTATVTGVVVDPPA